MERRRKIPPPPESIEVIQSTPKKEENKSNLTNIKRSAGTSVKNYSFQNKLTEKELNKNLEAAIERNDIKKLNEILSSGANPNFKSSSTNTTPLMLAAMRGNPEIISTLIKAGADVNARTKSGWSALFDAADHGHATAVKILLDAGAEVNIGDDMGRTPLGAAANNEVASILKKYGANSYWI